MPDDLHPAAFDFLHRWGGAAGHLEWERMQADLRELATVLRQEEREACARVCESVHRENLRVGLTQRATGDEAAAIRALSLEDEPVWTAPPPPGAWIACETRLPPKGEIVLIWAPGFAGDFCDLGQWDGKCWWEENGGRFGEGEIRWWQPLPAGPAAP